MLTLLRHIMLAASLIRFLILMVKRSLNNTIPLINMPFVNLHAPQNRVETELSSATRQSYFRNVGDGAERDRHFAMSAKILYIP